MPAKMEFIRPWRRYRVGAVFEPNGVLRSVLLRRGFVKPHDPPVSGEVVDAESDEPEAMTREAHTNMAVRTTPLRQYRCKLCGELGHNARGCPNANKDSN